jgi:hypothetical protein
VPDPRAAAEQFKYPAWLTLAGSPADGELALAELRSLYAGNPEVLRHLGTYAGRLARAIGAGAG